MTILDESDSSGSPGPRRSSSTLIVFATGAVVLVVALVAAWYFTRPEPAPEEPPAAASVKPAAPPVAKPPEVAPTPEPEAPRKAPRRPKPAPGPAAPPPAPKPAVTLKIDSDVPGAMIFLDRQFLGNAPVETSEVTPGSHTINASAEGYPGVVEKVDVAEGANETIVRFRVVRLNESIAVVHKHTFGSCEGRLVANPTGIRYETTNKDDRFSVAFDRLETFEVNYLEKNLKLKIRGGKSFNFTDKNDNADALFVFHKNVQDARKRLARGDTPAK